MISRFLIIAIVCTSCTSYHAPVSERDTSDDLAVETVDRHHDTTSKPTIQQSQYIVKKGDTLYSIAWRHNLYYRDIAKWNNITTPYTIYPDQVISLVAAKLASSKATKKQPKQEPSKQVKKTAKLSKGLIKWQWPIKGQLIKEKVAVVNKGITISGSRKQKIKAAAAGEVVYSGNNVLGYGNLIIIKHNEVYLSAYAYNSEILVREGEQVKLGQIISVIGQDNIGRTVLHFEIRKNGNSVPPLKYLPVAT